MFYQISDPEVFTWWDGGQEIKGKRFSTWRPAEQGIARRLGSEAYGHSPESRRAPFRGVGPVELARVKVI